MWAIAIAGILAAGAQMYQTSVAQGASQKQLDQIKQMYDNITPPDFPYKITDPPQQIQSFAQSLPPTSFDTSKVQMQDYQVMQQLAPNLAPYVAEKSPQLIQQTQDMTQGRQAETNALQKYQDVANNQGIDPQLAAQLSAASQQAKSDANSQSASILQDMQRRGMAGGSGMALASQLQGGASAMNREAQEGQQAAAQSYQNRLQALASGAQLGSQIQNEDETLQSRNSDIINAFNQRTSAAQQAQANQQAATQNAAQQFNIQNAQNVSNMNTQQNNQESVQNQQMRNQLAQTQWGQQQQQQSRQDTLNQYLNSLNQQQYQNQVGAGQYQNNQVQQGFQNELAKAQGQQGIGTVMAQNALNSAAARNQQIQGAFDTGIGAYQADQNRQAQISAAKIRAGQGADSSDSGSSFWGS